MITNDLIASRPAGRTGLAEWYSAVFDAQRKEGLTTAELATLLEVTPSNLSYWNRRLRSRPLDSGKTDAGPGKIGLVKVCVAARERPSPPRQSLELRLAAGRSILVPSGFDPDDLRALLSAL